MAAEITVMAQGFKPATDNIPLRNPIQPYGAFLSSAPLCPPCSEIKITSLDCRFWAFRRQGGKKLLNSTSCTLDWLVLEQPDDTPGGGGGEQLWAAITDKSQSKMQQRR